MIKKLNILKAIFVIALINSIVVLCVGQNAPGFNAFNENPTEVINIATQEIKKLKNISYNATYENIGAFSTSNSPAKGEIVLNNIKAKSHLDLNLWAKGFDIKEAKAEPFEVGYANKTMFRVRPSQKIITRKIISDTDVTEREFGFITGFFGRAFQKLTLFEIFQDNPFESLLNGKLLEYEGIALINDIPCHVIYAEFGESNSRTYKQRWYFGTKDYLPRRIEKITVNDTGKVGINTLTLSNLQTNTTVNPQLFSIKLPTGYSIKDYESPIEPPSLLTVGDFAHEWSLKDETGKTHSLSNYRGKVVVMDFWATWCGPCIKSMPEIENIHKKYIRYFLSKKILLQVSQFI